MVEKRYRGWYGDGWEGNGAQKRKILHFSSSPFTLILDRTLFVGKIASPWIMDHRGSKKKKKKNNPFPIYKYDRNFCNFLNRICIRVPNCKNFSSHFFPTISSPAFILAFVVIVEVKILIFLFFFPKNLSSIVDRFANSTAFPFYSF